VLAALGPEVAGKFIEFRREREESAAAESGGSVHRRGECRAASREEGTAESGTHTRVRTHTRVPRSLGACVRASRACLASLAIARCVTRRAADA